jgi:DNA mismatch repair protein MLH1
MIASFRSDAHPGIERILKKHTYVGIVDFDYCAIQYGTKLLLLNYAQLVRELFFQLAIRQFAVMPRILLAQPVDVKEFLLAALDLPEATGWENIVPTNSSADNISSGNNLDNTGRNDGGLVSPSDNNRGRAKGGGRRFKDENERELVKDKVADAAVSLLIENSEMLDEYFRIGINSSGLLCSLPDLLPGYTPSVEALPLLLLRLATETNWEEEEACFRSIAKELSLFYCKLPNESNENGVDDDEDVVSVDHPSISTDRTQTVQSNGASQSLSKSTVSRNRGRQQAECPGPVGSDIVMSLFLPAMRAHLLHSKKCPDDGIVVEIAALEQLYKVFERC